MRSSARRTKNCCIGSSTFEDIGPIIQIFCDYGPNNNYMGLCVSAAPLLKPFRHLFRVHLVHNERQDRVASFVGSLSNRNSIQLFIGQHHRRQTRQPLVFPMYLRDVDFEGFTLPPIVHQIGFKCHGTGDPKHRDANTASILCDCIFGTSSERIPPVTMIGISAMAETSRAKSTK